MDYAKQREKLAALSVADLLALLTYFEKFKYTDEVNAYGHKCWSLCQEEWTRRRYDIFGKSE